MVLYCFLIGMNRAMRLGGSLGYRYALVACTLRAAFYGMLRPGEVFKGHVADFVRQPQVRGDPVGIFIIRRPKNWQHFGRTQFAIIRDKGACDWLAWAMAGRIQADLIWPGSEAALRQILKQIFADAGLEACHFNFSSARPGGTTHF